MKKALIIMAGLALVTGCKQESKSNQLDSMKWLLGAWEQQSDAGVLQEQWTAVNDTMYTGASYYIKGQDTLHNEQIKLEVKDDQVLYVPTVKGQNGDQPVIFLLTKQSAKQLVFENPNHDYPKKIVYNLVRPDSLVAVISGVQQGKADTETFGMKKVK